MRRLGILGTALAAMALAACGSSSSSSPPGGGGGGGGFPRPAGTVAVNFTVDDSANQVYQAGELLWKGSMVYDSTTRKIGDVDASWGGPWAPLYDDGPWTAGGHEPVGATAGDHKWGVSVFATPPATGSATYSYGLVDHAFGDGWIWVGANGNFVINAGATSDLTANGLTLPPFGTIDLELVIDTNNLDAGGTWDTSKVAVKGSAFAWSLTPLLDNGALGDATSGDGKYTFVLSNYVGAGHTLYHTGMCHSGDQPEFVFTFGPTDKEYKVGGSASAVGVTARYKPAGGAWTSVAVQTQTSGFFNTYVTIP